MLAERRDNMERSSWHFTGAAERMSDIPYLEIVFVSSCIYVCIRLPVRLLRKSQVRFAPLKVCCIFQSKMEGSYNLGDAVGTIY